MARSFSATHLVTLPRLSALSAARLITQLVTAAGQEKKLPAAIVATRDALVPVRDALEAELGKRTSGASEETPVVRAADMVEDNAFGALVDWLRSFARLPADRHPQATVAQEVINDVFKDGLEFLKSAPVNEWQEAEVRLGLLRDNGHRESIMKLGGKAFLDELDTAHDAYGKAVGTTVVKPVVETPALREALDDARHELRAYVLAVTAQVSRKDPTTQALADRLLAPLIHWRDNASKGAAAITPAARESAKPGTEKSAPAVAVPTGG